MLVGRGVQAGVDKLHTFGFRSTVWVHGLDHHTLKWWWFAQVRCHPGEGRGLLPWQGCNVSAQRAAGAAWCRGTERWVVKVGGVTVSQLCYCQGTRYAVKQRQ